MTKDMEEIPKLNETTVTIRTKSGSIPVPAVTHEYCPGLAVTMHGFGNFQVTHIGSGTSMSGIYQRAGTATMKMTEWALIARAGDSDWSKVTGENAAAFLKSIEHLDAPIPGATITSEGVTHPMTIADFCTSTKLDSGFLEFPWEDSDPYNRAHEMLQLLQPKTPLRRHRR